MLLFPTLAKKIISEVKKLLNEDVVVIDVHGIIIACTDESRVGDFHEGALIACKEKRKFIISKEDTFRLRGVKAGINLPLFFNKEVIGVIGITGDPAEVSRYGDLLKKMTELFVREGHYKEQTEWQLRSLETFIWEWVHNDWSEHLEKQGSILGIHMNLKRHCVLIKMDDQKHISQHEFFHFLWQRFGSYTNDILARWGSDRLILLEAIEGEVNRKNIYDKYLELQKMIYDRFNLKVSMGIGQVFLPNELRYSYQQAEKALVVASKNNSIVFEDELRLQICLQEISTKTKSEFIYRTISPLLKDVDLLETLQVYIQHNLSLKQSAETLHVHINTLHYRLQRIFEVTGLDPKNVHDLVILYISILFLDDYTIL